MEIHRFELPSGPPGGVPEESRAAHAELLCRVGETRRTAVKSRAAFVKTVCRT